MVRALIPLERRTGGVGAPEAGRETLVKRNVDAETNLRVIFGGVQHQLALGLLQRRVRLWFGCEGGERVSTEGRWKIRSECTTISWFKTNARAPGAHTFNAILKVGNLGIKDGNGDDHRRTAG